MIPYFYIIEHIETGKSYAGAKWASDADPSVFMQPGGYTTSSNLINKIIKKEGVESFKISVLLTETDCKMPVLEYETKFLQENNCAKSKLWFNTHNNHHHRSKDSAILGGRTAGNLNYINGVGIHNKENPHYIEWRIAAGKAGAKTQSHVDKGKKGGKIVGDENVRLKRGMFSEEFSELKPEIGRRVGKNSVDKKLGIFNPEYQTSQKRKDACKKGGKSHKGKFWAYDDNNNIKLLISKDLINEYKEKGFRIPSIDGPKPKTKTKKPRKPFVYTEARRAATLKRPPQTDDHKRKNSESVKKWWAKRKKEKEDAIKD